MAATSSRATRCRRSTSAITPTRAVASWYRCCYAVPDFDHHLLLAIGNAFKGAHTEALVEVRKARATIDSGGMIESAYVFVEVLERLSEETKRGAYLEVALDYARAYQRLEPWTSWAYAFEARHAASGAARIRAAGIALKLDPQSQWLRELDKQTLALARQWATANHWPGKDAPRAGAKWDQAGL
jgi:hypothetical protein